MKLTLIRQTRNDQPNSTIRAPMKSVHRIFVFTMVLAMLSGCDTTDPGFSRIINEPMPVSGEMRSSFGIIGVLSARNDSDFGYAHPVSTSNAIAVMTAKGIRAAVEVSFSTNYCDFGDQMENLGVGLVLAGVFGMVGGFMTGVPEADMNKAEKAMSRAIQDEPMEHGVLMQMRRLTTNSSSPNFTIIPDSIRTNLNPAAVTNRDFHELAGSGIDSVLILQLVNEQFAPGKGSNPLMAVDINLAIRIVRVSDGADLFVKTLEYQGEQLQFTQWGANNAKLFHAELKVAQRTFAEAILDELRER